MGDTEAREWYPKMAASYQLGQVSVFDNLKLRGAWGQTGNMPQAKSKYTTMSSANIGGVNGLVASSTLGNSSIKPERTTELEFGTRFFTPEWFNDSRSNLLTNKTLKILSY